VVLDALNYTKEKFELCITGRGELEPLVSACRDSRVHYLGYLKYEEYQKALSETDVCVNAQLAKGEFGNASFPSKIYEYLSYGKLVISSDVADVGEALGQIAFLYRDDDPKALAECMDQVIRVTQNPEELSVYRDKIREFVEENSMERVAQKVNCMLKEIADKKNG
jgi:glycosyltransferase involved in cell wall biosynthesis